VFGDLLPIGVAASFSMERRRELAAELSSLIIDMAAHPWGGALEEMASRAAPGPGSRWNPGKDLSFVPLRPELVAEVRYNHMDGGRLRHPAQFLRWRPDRDPGSCGFDQLERPSPVAVSTFLTDARVDG
jgi:ATP-dependent DNA ligase